MSVARVPWQQLRYMMTSRRLGLFLCLVGFVWGVTLMNMTLVGYDSNRESETLKKEILQLSEKYVKALSKETENTIDGPYAGRLTGYDLKKTMAVLLDNLMERIDNIEKKLDMVTGNQSQLPPKLPHDNKQLLIANSMKQDSPNFKPAAAVQSEGRKEHLKQEEPKAKSQAEKQVDAKGLILGQQENCKLTEAENKKFPHCTGKMGWMMAHWKSDPCYREYGVDGSECSFRLYLSEVENWCPVLPGRAPQHQNRTKKAVEKQRKVEIPPAFINYNLEGLMKKLQDPGQRKNYAWIRMRIHRLWGRWVTAAKQLEKKQSFQNRSQKRITVHLGLISKASGWRILDHSMKGGPLGELVQWSDIISALYILGHELTITSEVEQLQAYVFNKKGKAVPADSCPSKDPFPLDLIYTDLVGLRQLKKIKTFQISHHRILAKFPSAESQCQSRERLPIDMIYTDIVGLTQFRRKVKNGYGKFSCLLRIIDSFGTEPAFNYEPYAKSHHMKTQWGMQNLNPQQLFTMFPHSPDNSFMGFVVENHINDTAETRNIVRKNQALVYGKAEYMWQGKEEYLNIIRQFVDIHGTVFVEKPQKSSVPAYVKNHGILTGAELHTLLRESKLFIGLGFPYEGPAPLEAIAQGAVYINPRFQPPHNSQNTKFFKGKPTLRKLTSQHPYAEDFIDEPHVFTVDINNPEEVKAAIKKALKAHDDGKVSSYLPYEYREEGMIQRLNAYIEHQDFCGPSPPLWPPESAVEVVLGQQGKSCKEMCKSHNKICEPSHFKRLNTESALTSLLGPCKFTYAEDIYFPAYQVAKKTCVLQKQPLLFSCVGEHIEYARACPCRDYLKEQTALCSQCL